ncbi:MAG TPA: alanine racemase [Candidatus Limnocylindria bacterium]|nr:alanine racemase [Candidatus Limnocylindria bacterium]
MSRAAIAILSTENLLHNLAVIKSHAPQSKVIAMVKANAYGHGLRSVSLRLQKHVYSLGVASIDEALALRDVGIKIPITLMEGVFEPDELLVASCQGFHVVFHEQEQLRWLERLSLPLPLTAWLKIDTGMGRLGITMADARQAYQHLANNKFIVQPIGIMSHLACADELDHTLNKQQLAAFADFVSNLPGPKSLCNSAGVFQFKHHQYDVVRPGIALYGASPLADKSAAELGLKPVMTLQTRLISARIVPQGSAIGYGSRFVCPQDMPIGVIAMGYGDGYPRTVQEGTPILVNGTRCTIIGRVSMDMATIDLRPCPTATIGDPVILWGEGLPVDEVAQFTHHVSYDILTGVQSRVKFHWTLNV